MSHDISMGERQIQWGANLRQARIAAGLTQTQLAELGGVGQASVSRWESGKEDITDDNKITVARVLSVDPDQLFPLGGF